MFSVCSATQRCTSKWPPSWWVQQRCKAKRTIRCSPSSYVFSASHGCFGTEDVSYGGDDALYCGVVPSHVGDKRVAVLSLSLSLFWVQNYIKTMIYKPIEWRKYLFLTTAAVPHWIKWKLPQPPTAFFIHCVCRFGGWGNCLYQCSKFVLDERSS